MTVKYYYKNIHNLCTILLVLFALLSYPCDSDAIDDNVRKDMVEDSTLQEDSLEGVIESSGRLLPLQSYTLYLNPGERIIKSMVAEGEVVKKGVPMIELSNDRLINEFAMLQEKEMIIEKDRNRAAIFKIKLKIANDIIKRLDKQIDNENQIYGKASEYIIESKVRELLETKRMKEDEVQLLTEELSLLETSIVNRTGYSNFLSVRIKDVQAQIDRLLIKAPFTGRVVRNNKSIDRVKAGDWIFELWDDKSMKVAAWVYQNQLQHVMPGYKVQISPEFYKDSFVWGTIRSIGPSRGSLEKNKFPEFPVTIDIDNNQPGLVVGMAVTVRIISPDYKGMPIK